MLLLFGLAYGQGIVIPPVSGLLKLGPELYVTAHDIKEGRTETRLGVLRTQPGCRFAPLPVDWSKTGESNDVESITLLEGRTDRLLACESGYYQGKFGRLFLLELDPERLRARSLASVPLPELSQEIEGLVSRRLGPERYLVVLGGRGGRTTGEPGRLYWGTLDLSAGRPLRLECPPEGLVGEELQIPARLGPHTRTISDMFLDAESNLWVSACVDPSEEGPFRSLVYGAGKIHARERTPFERPREAATVWRIEGFKVEGLAAAPRPGFGPAFATDDEVLDGLWRALPPP